jgi:hypothetical protein
MPFSLYDATVPSFQQTLGAMQGLLDKVEGSCAEADRPVEDLLQARLADDMLPFVYQVRATTTHSVGALNAIHEGVFKPDRTPAPQTLQGLRDALSQALEALSSMTAEDLNGLVGRDMRFEAGEMVLPFTVEGFLMSFSMPNFFFHAATAYDILRMKGFALGKRDYLGRPRFKT